MLKVLLTSLGPIVTSLSSTSDRGTFKLFRCEIALKDDIGETTKSSVTMYIDGPFIYSPEFDDFEEENLGSTKFKGTLLPLHVVIAAAVVVETS
jgi:hypothetical protein